MLFVEEDVDMPPDGRLIRWFEGYAQPGDVYLPLVMVDSGNEVSNGEEDFATVYSQMIDAALQRPPGAQMAVESTRVGDLLRFDVRLTNTSGTTLSVANEATLTALVYLEPGNPSSVPAVLRSQASPITSLADGESASITLEVVATGLDSASTRWVVIADYRPGGLSGPYDMLQAATGP